MTVLTQTPLLSTKDLPQFVSCTEQYDDHMEAIKKGATTADQVREWFDWFCSVEEEVTAELSKLTVKEIKKRLTYSHSTRKAGLVKELYGVMQNSYGRACPSGADGWYPMQEEYVDHLRRKLGKLTDEHIKAYAEDIAQRSKNFVKALTDPQTWDEYRQFAAYLGMEKLEPEQRDRYDLLYSIEMVERKAADMVRRAHVTQINLEEGITLIKRKDYHTKRNCDIWLVRPSERIDRPTFNELKEKARKYSVRWSGWPRNEPEKHGFCFFSEDDADAFMALQNEDGSVLDRWNRVEEARQEKAANRLQDHAGRMETGAEDSLGQERLTNTQRRVRMALSAMATANEEIRFASVLGSIGEALETGRLRLLQHVRHATQVRVLDYYLRDSRNTAVRQENGGRYVEPAEIRPVELNDIRQARYPYPRVSCSEAYLILNSTKGKRGHKWNRQALQHALNNAVQDQKDSVLLETYGLREAVCELLGTMGRDVRWDCVRSRFADSQRLERMGIGDITMLRAALREFFTHRVEKMTTIDEIYLMELDLVGRKIAGYFPTPEEEAGYMVELANLEENLDVCEPSAGNGRIALAIRHDCEHLEPVNIDVYEINYRLREILEALGYRIAGYDFLESRQMYDRFIMNPPFENGMDMVHVQHAYHNLAENGRIVAVMSEGAFFRSTGLAPSFREWFDEVGGWTDRKLPAGTFRESGTNVSARIIVIDK